jgi:hypothetical protein
MNVSAVGRSWPSRELVIALGPPTVCFFNLNISVYPVTKPNPTLHHGDIGGIYFESSKL